MRDGVKLFTVIIVPKGATNAPILLTRTPYNASRRVARNNSPHMLAALPAGDEVFVEAGYIRVFQDVRGKYKSEGDYVMTRPVRGPLNPTGTDHVTDAYDTIDWLVKNTPESNGRVGMLGSSYEGFTVVMALLGPHPALKVAAPESPMVDGWMGDDWFHYGAFRQVNPRLFLANRPRRETMARPSRAAPTTITRTSAGWVPRAITFASTGWSSCRSCGGSWNTLPTTPFGKDRRSTSWWPSTRRRSRPCGFKGYGTRRICGARFTATWRSRPKVRWITITW